VTKVLFLGSLEWLKEIRCKLLDLWVFQSAVKESQSAVLGSQSAVKGSQSAVQESQSAIKGSKSAVKDHNWL